MSNVFAAGTTILSRLASELTGIESVMWASAAIGPNAENEKLPIAFLQPGQAQGTDDTVESDATRETQLWQIGLRVELDPAAATASSAEVAMGVLIYDTINALRGYSIPSLSGKGRMNYLSRTEMQYPPGTGYGEVWLTFDAVTIVRRT